MTRRPMTDAESDAYARSLEDDYEAAIAARYEGAGDPTPDPHDTECDDYTHGPAACACVCHEPQRAIEEVQR